MNITAIIPARGGSKGIPNKNINVIAGKPLIAWTIEQALESTLIDTVYVSTDSHEIAQISTEYGAKIPFLRPQNLASDTASTEAVIMHFIDWVKKNNSTQPDVIVLLQCTSPVRHEGSIDKAITHFISGEYDSTLSAVPFDHFLWKNPEFPSAQYDYQNRPRRQDIMPEDSCFRENGSIYVTKESIYRKHSNRLGGKIGMYIMSEEESYEIDTPTDWAINEAILKLKTGGSL